MNTVRIVGYTFINFTFEYVFMSAPFGRTWSVSKYIHYKVNIFLSKVMNSLNLISLTFMSLKVDTRPPTGSLFCMTWSISEGQALNMLTASHHKHTQSKMRSSTALLAVLAFLTHGETYGSVTLLMFLWLHSDPSCCFGLYSVLILLYFLPSLLLMCSKLKLRWILS